MYMYEYTHMVDLWYLVEHLNIYHFLYYAL